MSLSAQLTKKTICIMMRRLVTSNLNHMLRLETETGEDATQLLICEKLSLAFDNGYATPWWAVCIAMSRAPVHKWPNFFWQGAVDGCSNMTKTMLGNI